MVLGRGMQLRSATMQVTVFRSHRIKRVLSMEADRDRHVVAFYAANA